MRLKSPKLGGDVLVENVRETGGSEVKIQLAVKRVALSTGRGKLQSKLSEVNGRLVPALINKMSVSEVLTALCDQTL